VVKVVDYEMINGVSVDGGRIANDKCKIKRIMNIC
jgi:hypothetical protein